MGNFNNLSNSGASLIPHDVNEAGGSKSSKFDLSYMKLNNVIEGAIMPIDVYKVVPKTRVNLSYDIGLFTRNPTVRAYKGSFRLYVKSFYCKSTDLWEGAEIFYNPEKQDANLSQYANLQIPKLEPHWTDTTNGVKASGKHLISSLSVFAPSSYMGIPFEGYHTVSTNPILEGIQGADISSIPYTTPYSGATLPSYIVGLKYNGDRYNGNYHDNSMAHGRVWDTWNGGTVRRGWVDNIDALPFVMYTKIYRSFFMHKNLMATNTDIFKAWYPALARNFRIPIDPKNIAVDGTPTYGENTAGSGFQLGTEDHNYINVLNYEHPLLPCNGGESIGGNTQNLLKHRFDGVIYPFMKADSILAVNLTYPEANDGIPRPVLNTMYFADAVTDYYDKVSPFPDLVRHDLPNMKDLTGDGVFTDFNKAFANGTGASVPNAGKMWLSVNGNNNLNTKVYDSGMATSTDDNNGSLNSYMLSAFNKNRLNATVNAWRNFVYANRMNMKLSRTNGTFNMNMRANFGKSSEHINEYEPKYIGGFYQDVVFSETTSAQNGVGTLGYKASTGVSVNNGHICSNFVCDGYGYIMTIAYLVPNTIYESIGLNRMWFDTTQEDVYLPEKNMLPCDTLKMKEISIYNDTLNSGVYAYQPKFEYLKHRTNIACNLFSNTGSTFDSALMTKRTHSTAYNWWCQKVIPSGVYGQTPLSVDRQAFSDKLNPLFDMQTMCKCKLIMPMPYEAKPMEI